MNLSKKVIYFVTFLIVFILLPYLGYKIYIGYQDGLYKSYKEYSSYTTFDGDHTVMVMDTKQFGSDEYVTLKIYLKNNKTDKYTYICTQKCRDVDPEKNIEYSEDKKSGKNTVTVTVNALSTAEKTEIDLNTEREYTENKLILFLNK